MTRDEARTLLIEQGALMVKARVDAADAAEAWLMAAGPVMEAADYVAQLTPDEQELCFRESCIRAGVDPEDQRLEAERSVFEAMRMEHHDARIRAQLQNAELN